MPEKPRVRIRKWKKADIPKIVECYKASYPEYSADSARDTRYYEMEFEAFPQGQFLAESDGKVVGYATSLIVQLDEESHLYHYSEITGSDTFSTHDQSGDTLYGADIAVHPKYRGQGISQKLYRRRKKLVQQYNLKRMVAYGRISGYHEYAGKLTADEYVREVERGRIKDSALNAHLKAGYKVKRVLLQVLRDRRSLGHSTFLEWLNPKFDVNKHRIATAPIKGMTRKVRVCSAQYMMRLINTWDEFEATAEFFVDTADVYHCHFLLLPELFTAQLFSIMPLDVSFVEAVSRLAELTEQYQNLFSRLAVERGLYIIAGTHPVLRDGKLYNVAHMFTPSGKMYTQDKLHITPAEREDFGISPGEGLVIFDTPLARVAIQVCYDIEFPEPARMLGLAGVEIVFVPFSTDEKKAYYRVRYTAAARAVENSYYVVLSGNVGNLPTIKNYLLNYGQSVVLTPSDMAFPTDGIAGQADPNCETVVIAELDLTTLAMQRDLGSVRPYHDRRPDLYRIESKEPVQIVVTD